MSAIKSECATCGAELEQGAFVITNRMSEQFVVIQTRPWKACAKGYYLSGYNDARDHHLCCPPGEDEDSGNR